jgi:hypothetical protein
VDDQPYEDEALARFQAALTEVLGGDAAPEARVWRLGCDARAAPFGAYVAGFELRCVEVAAALHRRWSVRRAGSP